MTDVSHMEFGLIKYMEVRLENSLGPPLTEPYGVKGFGLAFLDQCFPKCDI